MSEHYGRTQAGELIGPYDTVDELNRELDDCDLTLVLPDGTRYEGRGQYDEAGRLIRDMATCEHCGFSWNDALSTSITPTPSGRCPNEYGHEHYDDEYECGDDD